MNTAIPTALELQAITAAKNQDWQTAIEHNKAIVEHNPSDINAFIRLGVAHAQLGENKAAKEAFNQALELDKSNQLAKKHLQKLKNHQTINLSTLPTDEQFIEEPGKTRTVELHRLTNKEQLEQLSIGQACELKPKNRFISVEANKTYIGSLPEDISSRLSKLMKSGNEYVCYVRSVNATSCTVFIKELKRSPENEFVNSFPVSKNQLATLNDMYMSDELPLEMEDIPLQIVETDNDDGSVPDTNFPTEEQDSHHEEPAEEDQDTE